MPAALPIANIAKTAVGAAIGYKTAGRGLVAAGVGLVATRIAMGSLPGAVVIGGAIAAKTIYDIRKSRKAD